MRRAIAGSVGLGLVLCACATAGRHASGDPYYRCEVEQAEASGLTTLQFDLSPDGTLREAHAVWTTPPHQRGARVKAEWFGPNLPLPSDDLRVTISYPRIWRAGRPLRLELFRSPDSRTGDGVLADPSYYRSGPALAITRWRSELHRFASGRSDLLAGVAQEGDGLLAQDRIELTRLDLAGAAFARAEPRLEAMVADYRNACQLTEDRIIVT